MKPEKPPLEAWVIVLDHHPHDPDYPGLYGNVYSFGNNRAEAVAYAAQVYPGSRVIKMREVQPEPK